MSNNTGRVAVITGASSGIGEATARAFALSRPRTVSLNEILVRPTGQAR